MTTASPSPFVAHTLDTAPAAARPALEHAQNAFGFLPSPLARWAEAPATIAAFNTLLAHWERSSLGALDREVLALVVSYENGCEYCVALHSASMARLGAEPPLVRALREGRALPDDRLEALAAFVRAVLRDRGAVPVAVRDAFFAAGFTKKAALEVVLGVTAYTLSTLANRLTEAPLDPAFEPFRWERSESSPR